MLSNNQKSIKSLEIQITYSRMMSNWHVSFLAEYVDYDDRYDRLSQISSPKSNFLGGQK